MVVGWIGRLELMYVHYYIGEGNGTPLQYSCLENPMDGGSWWAAAHGVIKSQSTQHQTQLHSWQVEKLGLECKQLSFIIFIFNT